MERGNIIEPWAVEKLHSMFGKDRCLFMGSQQVTFFDEYLSITPDGAVIDLERDCLADIGIADIGGYEIQIEIKSVDPSINLDGKPKPRHEGQIICQMGGTQRNTNYKPMLGAVLYFNPLNLQDMCGSPYFVEYDEAVYQKAKVRAASVFEPGKTALDFEPEGKWLNECRYCEFSGPCRKAEAEAYPNKVVKPEEIDPEVLAKAEVLVKELHTLKGLSKEAVAAEKEANAKVQALMNEIGTNRLYDVDAEGKKWGVSYIFCKGRMSLDKASLAVDLEGHGIALEDYEKQGDPYFQLRTKVE